MADSPGIVINDEVVATTGRKVGYAIAIVLNGLLLYVVNNVLAWGWFPWLTDDFEQVLPILNVSIVVTMVVYTVFLVYDPKWFKTVADIVTTSFSIAVFIRTWQVFPFDFSAYDFNWEAMVRVVIVLGLIGTSIAVIVNVVLLVRIAFGLVAEE